MFSLSFSFSSHIVFQRYRRILHLFSTELCSIILAFVYKVKQKMQRPLSKPKWNYIKTQTPHCSPYIWKRRRTQKSKSYFDFIWLSLTEHLNEDLSEQWAVVCLCGTSGCFFQGAMECLLLCCSQMLDILAVYWNTQQEVEGQTIRVLKNQKYKRMNHNI